MGSGASKKTRVETFDKANQMPSTADNRPHQRKLSGSSDRVFVRSVPKPKGRSISPLEEDFELTTNIEDYSVIWDHDTKLSSPFQRSTKSDPVKFNHYQKEILENKTSKKHSTAYDSAHIESIIDTQTNSSIYVSSSEKIDELIKNLNDIHGKLDEIIKQRTGQISNETESVLLHIRNETHQKQERLLNYAKQKQQKQDENYQKSLQEYIHHLDQIKAQELSQLQNQLQLYRDQILEESQLKIMTVNEQANYIKAQILKDEQQKATEKIDSIMEQIQKISSDDKLQHLGSEILTQTNIITNANVGSKPPGLTSIPDTQQQYHQPSARPSQSNKKKTNNDINE